ncbi:MAG: hypothetical protein E7058_00985 [Lentisphaerae bacterium]|nr:hypothetical protein [Lentisphaerota bacterium]
MKKILTISLLLCGIICSLSAEIVLRKDGKPARYAGVFNRGVIEIRDFSPRKNEFRGIWVAVVENIDFASHSTAAGFQKDFRVLVNNAKRAGFTAVIFQIRSNCDAFYPSKFAPWSRWLAGKEGVGLDRFDPLAFMIAETHRAGMEFHAWLNPYRVTNKTKLSKNAYLKTLAPGNFARLNPHCVLVKKHPDGNQLLLDPGVPQVVDHLCAVVGEVVRNYPVDAIHFDDYFYPYEKIADEDAASFRRYNPGRLPLDVWRRNNTDTLVYNVRLTITRNNILQKRRVRFGISPFGIWGNRKNYAAGSLTGGKESYSTLFADTRKWVKNGYIDYIAPQIYWDFDHDVAAYAALADWWCAVVRGTGVKLYIGIGAYNGGRWRSNELIDQVRFNRMRPEISGAAFFSYRSFFGKERNAGAQRLIRYFQMQRKK